MKLERSFQKFQKNWKFSSQALPEAGVMIAECMVQSALGESIEYASSSVINVQANLMALVDNIKTQCAFGHIEHLSPNSNNWTQYYKDSETLKEDIGDDISVKIIRKKFAYPEEDGLFKYKRIKVKGKYYIQKFKRKNGKYVFDGRYKVKGRKANTDRSLEVLGEI